MSVRDVIEQKLSSAFRPAHLEIANESHKHSVPPNSETHFKVVLVSEGFAGQRKVARHQQVYATLAEELAGGVHALALHLYTGEEWAARQQPAPRSPDCMGGSKRDHAT
ncbi:MAG TPA: BolA/IbaG family iron-sulfur metabolism protein [Spongiibacteraceae bacterium]|nr:BolA/IbaG family iron-sulfur metabolism protein [Spongiibacteraceae bacterium]